MPRVIIDGSTLRDYIRLLKHGDRVGVREAQRILGYGSPGKAQRFLERLVRAGLARKCEDGRYEIIEKPLNMAGYLVIRGLVIPKVLVAATSATAMALTYAVLSNTDVVTKAVIVVLTIPYWLEVITTVKMLSELK